MCNLIREIKNRKYLQLLRQTRVRSIEDITNKINTYNLGHNIVENVVISGCNREQIQLVEDEFGILPATYKNIMLAVGKSIKVNFKKNARFISITGCKNWDFYLDEIVDVNRIMFNPEYLDEIEEDSHFPGNTFIIYSSPNSIVYFVLTGQNENDTPVYVDDLAINNKSKSLNGEYILNKAYESIWDWVDDYIENKI